jgi:transposase InsO family protein
VPCAERPGDLLERDFAADAPDRCWVADITYVQTASGWAYTARHDGMGGVVQRGKDTFLLRAFLRASMRKRSTGHVGLHPWPTENQAIRPPTSPGRSIP